MIIYDTTSKFDILGTTLSLFDSETAYGYLTCAEIDDKFYQLGDLYCNIETAVNVWQEVNGRVLSLQEIYQVYDALFK